MNAKKEFLEEIKNNKLVCAKIGIIIDYDKYKWFILKNGFSKNLELVGVGYRARLDGGLLVMSLGWNHPIKMTPPEGIQIEVPEETKITIKGFDKQKVGEFAAKIREIRKPEPYKGKGIRYENEYVRRKSSKASVA